MCYWYFAGLYFRFFISGCALLNMYFRFRFRFCQLAKDEGERHPMNQNILLNHGKYTIVTSSSVRHVKNRPAVTMIDS